MPVDTSAFRERIIANIRNQVTGNNIEMPILTNDKMLDELIDAIQNKGIGFNEEMGTDADGNLFFIVGISSVGGDDVVG